MRRLRQAAGVALLVSGTFGLLLPVSPGIPLLAAGMAVLGPEHPRLQTWIARLRQWQTRIRRAVSPKVAGFRERK